MNFESYLFTLLSNLSTRHSKDAESSLQLSFRSQTRHNGKVSFLSFAFRRIFGVVFAGAGIQWSKHRSWYPCTGCTGAEWWMARCLSGCNWTKLLFIKLVCISTWFQMLAHLKSGWNTWLNYWCIYKDRHVTLIYSSILIKIKKQDSLFIGTEQEYVSNAVIIHVLPNNTLSFIVAQTDNFNNSPINFQSELIVLYLYQLYSKCL